MMLPRFLQFAKYKVRDFKEFLSSNRIEIYIERDWSEGAECHRCGSKMRVHRGQHSMRLECLPIMGIRTYVNFMRYKFDCEVCGKARSEALEFVSSLTPHLTSDYAWWIGRVCEFSPVSRVAELCGHDETTTWRVDYHRMIAMLAEYRIPKIKRLSVDEVYARKRSQFFPSRDRCFFTVITDWDTRKVVWVTTSRSKDALDEFFKLIGKEACAEIEVVATDQHDAYGASVREYCPKATLVWDRFHILQNFENAVNETRKGLHEEQSKGSQMQLMTKPQYKYLFLKKAERRTSKENEHIDYVLKNNQMFAKLEIIKERMITFFDEPTAESARGVFDDVGDWIYQSGFKPLMKWHTELERGWETLKNYFTYRVTTAVSEGINNVIKALKRRGYGYRNMQYFKLKIMQVCGYLNSQHMPTYIQ